MAKQFVVRIRKGSPDGNIVANSQVITLNSPQSGNIFPSNFTDGRLQGKITTSNRTANFIKTASYIQPATTTTTQGPGTTTTTTTTTSSPSGGVFSLFKNSSPVLTELLQAQPGDTITIKCSSLTINSTYTVGIAIEQANPSLEINFKESWFNINFLDGAKPSNFEGWIKGGSLGPTIFPKGQYLNASAQYPIWYYTFKATATTKDVSVPIFANAQINYTNVQSDYIPTTVRDSAVISFFLGNEFGIKFYSTNNKLSLLDLTPQYSTSVAYDLNNQPLASSYIVPEGALKTFNQPAKITVDFKALQRPTLLFMPTNNSYIGTGRRYLINLTNLDSLDLTAQVRIGSTITSVTPANNANYPAGLNYIVDFTSSNYTSLTDYPNGVFEFAANSDNRIDNKTSSIKLFTYPINDDPVSNGNTFFANTSPYFLLANFPDVLRITDQGQFPVISNWRNSSTTLDEDNNREFTATFNITDSSVRTINWKILGSVVEADFTGPASGTILTTSGVITRNIYCKVAQDTVVESEENFQIVFYLGSVEFYRSDTVKILDSTAGSNPSVVIAAADEPPYYQYDTIKFVITNGTAEDTVDVYDGSVRYQSIKLDSNGGAVADVGPFSVVASYNLEFTFRTRSIKRYVTFLVAQIPVGGTSSGCPDPDTPISISPTLTKPAGELKVGDIIYTVHEYTLEYGYFEVVHANIIEEPKLKITFDTGKSITVSLSHKFMQAEQVWISARDLRQGSLVQTVDGLASVTNLAKMGIGDVVVLEINQAHTYIANGFISHNKISKLDNTLVRQSNF